MAATPDKQVHLLDYGAGNVRSIRNAITRLGYHIVDITKPDDFPHVKKLIFPGVGAFGSAVEILKARGMFAPLREYIKNGGLFFGICIGAQVLFEGSDESPEAEGLGILPGRVRRLDTELAVPHIGWNTLQASQGSAMWAALAADARVYFVHSYAAPLSPDAPAPSWLAAAATYGRARFVAAVQQGRVFASQFHPEKSGPVGLALLREFLRLPADVADLRGPLPAAPMAGGGLARRVIACLDVRTDAAGRPVVTKGDQYDVHDKAGKLRDLGEPAAMAARYYEQGADEVTFLQIAAHEASPLHDQQMLRVLEHTSQAVFVPLTIGGGIRDYRDVQGRQWTALEVAAAYFRAGADKVSIGSDAVTAAEAWHKQRVHGTARPVSSLEQISRRYGRQAVVVSIDPRRVYASAEGAAVSDWGEPHTLVTTSRVGPNGETRCWFQCTTRGGREGRACDVVALVRACEALGAGEFLLNSLDADGTNRGYDLELVRLVKAHATVPVIASSGAGRAEHLREVFEATDCEAALAAGMFHRNETTVAAVKQYLHDLRLPKLPIRIAPPDLQPGSGE